MWTELQETLQNYYMRGEAECCSVKEAKSYTVLILSTAQFQEHANMETKS